MKLLLAATDVVAKLKKIAALDLGGAPDEYDIGNETVFRRSSPSRRLTYAHAPQRAIEPAILTLGKDFTPTSRGLLKQWCWSRWSLPCDGFERS